MNSFYKLHSRQYMAKTRAYSRHHCFHTLVASVNSVKIPTNLMSFVKIIELCMFDVVITRNVTGESITEFRILL